eukprot:363785-Chlamydomonas_euryale.AAC.13
MRRSPRIRSGRHQNSVSTSNYCPPEKTQTTMLTASSYSRCILAWCPPVRTLICQRLNQPDV